MNLVHTKLSVHRELKGSFRYSEGLGKLLNGIFSASKDLESSFDHYGCPVKLMHASLGARKGVERNFRTAEVQLSAFMSVCV